MKRPGPAAAGVRESSLNPLTPRAGSEAQANAHAKLRLVAEAVRRSLLVATAEDQVVGGRVDFGGVVELGGIQARDEEGAVVSQRVGVVCEVVDVVVVDENGHVERPAAVGERSGLRAALRRGARDLADLVAQAGRQIALEVLLPD